MNVRELKTQIAAFDFNSENRAEWDVFYKNNLCLLGFEDIKVKEFAIDRIAVALRLERAPFKSKNYRPPSAEQRINPILIALEMQDKDFDPLVSQFCRDAHSFINKFYSKEFAEWLMEMAERKAFSSQNGDNIDCTP